MSNRTKLDLEAALKDCMLKKPFHKITIQDLTDACHMSRMSFYYHFKDLHDLVEWVCVEDAKQALQNKKHSENWQDGLLHVFEAVYENKPFVMNAYYNISREQIENFLFKLVHDLIMQVIEEKAKDVQISEEQKNFIANFYKYGFVGIMLDWIADGMKEDYHLIVEDMRIALKNTITTSIQNFTKN
ncbi:TetR/AcrR family transcriptional regulator [Amedibacterium intestinale]|uniref:TetR/AcrR family transcriptional regulator n=1 Tax=Amedibacterium intestinale TaxID=2583452 RepID=UPI000E473648|nr:TetR/AcrR family transcriptional regulator [Amedibacterium intestinale]RHO33943.1 TetR family transcriptional regulator [Erysipelotrichaceae bacterium AM17-60]